MIVGEEIFKRYDWRGTGSAQSKRLELLRQREREKKMPSQKTLEENFGTPVARTEDRHQEDQGSENNVSKYLASPGIVVVSGGLVNKSLHPIQVEMTMWYDHGIHHGSLWYFLCL